MSGAIKGSQQVEPEYKHYVFRLWLIDLIQKLKLGWRPERKKGLLTSPWGDHGWDICNANGEEFLVLGCTLPDNCEVELANGEHGKMNSIYVYFNRSL